MKFLLSLLFIGLGFYYANMFAEYAYFEGQKDALNGDIRIKKINDSTYTWIKSPWDSGDKPDYIPTDYKQ